MTVPHAPRPEWAAGLVMLGFVTALFDMWWPISAMLILTGAAVWWWYR